MRGLDFREEALFSQLFVPEQNQDCLVSMLNAMLDMESPLVSASFYQNGGLAVVRRDNSCIYIAKCTNEKGQTVEVSMILGMDSTMEPMLVKTFMGMAADQQIHGKGQVFSVNAILFLQNARTPEDSYKRIMVMENTQGDTSLNMEDQRFIVYSMDKFVFNRPDQLEELWLTFLKDPENDLLLRHPSLPEPIKKAILFSRQLPVVG